MYLKGPPVFHYLKLTLDEAMKSYILQVYSYNVLFKVHHVDLQIAILMWSNETVFVFNKILSYNEISTS